MLANSRADMEVKRAQLMFIWLTWLITQITAASDQLKLCLTKWHDGLRKDHFETSQGSDDLKCGLLTGLGLPLLARATLFSFHVLAKYRHKSVSNACGAFNVRGIFVRR